MVKDAIRFVVFMILSHRGIAVIRSFQEYGHSKRVFLLQYFRHFNIDI